MTHDELLAAITDAPNEDGPRIVYADWLQQQPDALDRARGEYIAVACSAQRSPARTARMAALLEEHEATWLGVVATITARRVWSRGFLEACTVLAWSDGARAHPVWRTLRVLDARELGAIPGPPAVEAVCHRGLRNLRTLCVVPAFVDAIAASAHPPRVHDLAIGWAMVPSQLVSAAVIPTLQDAPCFGRVRRLHVQGWSPDQAAVLARPDLTLAVVGDPGTLLRWLDVLDDRDASFEEVRIVPELQPLLVREGDELVLRRDGARWSHLEVRWTDADDRRRRSAIMQALGRIQPDRLTRVTFVGPARASFDTARWRTRIRATLATQPNAQID